MGSIVSVRLQLQKLDPNLLLAIYESCWSGKDICSRVKTPIIPLLKNTNYHLNKVASAPLKIKTAVPR